MLPVGEGDPGGESVGIPAGGESTGLGTAQSVAGGSSEDSNAPPKSARRRRRRSRGRGRARTGDVKAVEANTSEGQAASTFQPISIPVQTPAAGSVQQARREHVYAALDLGTNNCRLLLARRTNDGFRAIDAYSRIVRLGEGLSVHGRLSEMAMSRAIASLRVCADKMKRRNVTRARLIATQACRIAANGAEFLARVKQETGLDLDIVSTEDEARLAVAGCAPLLDAGCASALVFDIGGGSTELIWVKGNGAGGNPNGATGKPSIIDWTSLACGVVTLAERHGGVDVPGIVYERMVAEVSEYLAPFTSRLRAERDSMQGGFHLLGTSGTVTTLAGLHLDLPRYDRSRVDGIWLTAEDADAITRRLLGMNYELRAAHPCIGKERADLVLAGCAILEAIANAWPAERMRVADRGLREGILLSLMEEDDARAGRRRQRRRRRRRKTGPGSESRQAGMA